MGNGGHSHLDKIVIVKSADHISNGQYNIIIKPLHFGNQQLSVEFLSSKFLLSFCHSKRYDKYDW